MNNYSNQPPIRIHKEIDYYKRIAARAGQIRLRETEELSQLIAQLRQTQAALKKARDELELRVAERTAALSRTNAALKREIQERKRAATELVESEKKYRAMFEDSPDAMSLTQDGCIVDVNPAWLALHGYDKKSEVVGTDIIETIHAKDRHILENRRKSWPQNAKNGYPIRDVRKDGTIVDVEVFTSSIILKGHIAILATIHDLTERKQAEKEKHKLEARLRHSEKMEAIGALAGGVAHDLNNILSGIVSYPELLLLDLPEESPLREPIDTIKRSGQKASAIVQDLLTLARRGVPVTEVVNLNNVILEYLASPEGERIKQLHPKVHIALDLHPDPLCIMGSPVHLSKALMNLVSNAAEAMQDGGTISISTENQHIWESTHESLPLDKGDYVLLKVSDAGVGIAKSDLSRIFEPFFTKKKMGRSGTGLGMAVVWGTVKDHRGHIELDSVIGAGTQFSLYLPATQQKCPQIGPRPQSELWMGNGEHILVVDDVEEQRKIASSILSRLGYLVTSVASGEAALEYLQSSSMDLLLLDMIMEPGIDGYETYKQAIKIQPDLKAVIASGFSENNRVHRTQELGASGYIKKPYVLESIATAIRLALDETAPDDQGRTE